MQAFPDASQRLVNRSQTLQQPEPRPPAPPYASSLKDFVDPVRPHPSPESLHEAVSEWLRSIGSDREKRCRSDSHLHRSDDPVSRQLTRSAPASTRSRTSRADSGNDSNRSSASSTASVRNPRYRQTNLRFNHIHVLDATSPLPDIVSGHIDSIRAPRDSPGLSSEELNQAMYEVDVLARGCDEDQVTKFLDDTIFPDPRTSTSLMSNSGTLIAQHLVPADPASPYRVTQPKPDRLFGYSEMTRQGAFTQPQLLAQTMLHPRNPDYPTATSRGLRFPFFVIEFKAAGGTRGDLWVATNQCAGASAACLNAISQLNWALQEYQSTQRVDNLSYCIAVDNNLAKLYISWKEDDLSYYLQQVDTFVLSRPEEFENFRRQVRNILDWGKDARLTQIGDALDIILEEHRKSASEAAKSPSDGSVASGK